MKTAKYSNMEATKLNPELLLRLGFERCTGRHGEYFKHKTQSLFRIWYDEHTESWAIGRKDLDRVDEKYNTCFIRNGITTLHLLQNVFYYLTDELLTLSHQKS